MYNEHLTAEVLWLTLMIHEDVDVYSENEEALIWTTQQACTPLKNCRR